MLKRLMVILILATAISAGAPVMAGPISDAAVAQLRQKGYSKITVRRTLLGRIRIIADSDEIRREIVIHPLTGQVLRDNLASKSGARIAKEPEELDLGGGTHEDGSGGDNSEGGDGDSNGHGDGDGDGDGEGDGHGDGDGDGDGDGEGEGGED